MGKNKAKVVAAILGGTLVGACAAALALRGAHKADLHLFRTRFGLASVYTTQGPDGRPVRLLRVGCSVQSATYLGEDDYTEPVFDYYLAFDLMFEANPRISNVLVLGGGGYAYPKHLIATRPDVHVDVVEIDPQINAIAQNWFFLPKLTMRYDLASTNRLRMICADGAAYLADLAAALRDGPDGQATQQDLASHGSRLHPRYDAIVVDVFAAGKPVPSLADRQAARNARACLAPGGVLIANVVSTLEGPGSEFLHGYVAALESEFAHVRVVPLASDSPDNAPDNVIVMARDVDWDFEG